MRKVLLAIAALGVVVLLIVGLTQAGSKNSTSGTPPKALSRAAVSAPLRGVPPTLAALRRQVNVLRSGGSSAYDAELASLRGHPVVVNMWASWCGPCRYELPYFQRQAVRRGADVAFLGINVGDASGNARKFAATYPMPYPSFEDPHEKLLGRFGARGLPATAFYDARGKLQFLHQGLFPSERTLSDAIERYALS